MRRLVVLLAVPALVASPANMASASWSAIGTGKAHAKAGALTAGQKPVTIVKASGPSDGSATTNRQVDVSWAATDRATSYIVNGAMGTGCTGSLAVRSCTDNTGAATPTLGYSVTPVLARWSGEPSPTAAPGPVDLVLASSSTAPPQMGKPESNDTIAITFSAGIVPGSVCSGWSGGEARTITATLENNSGASGFDRFTFGPGTGLCTSGVNIGTIDLGATEYVTSSAMFSSSSMTLSGNTLSIKLGAGNPQPSTTKVPCTNGCPTASYVPASSLAAGTPPAPVLGTITKRALNF